ncbi:phytoene desaturase family protein [Mucilaginibacter ginkgonis]|uniref:phytoene desaturase family protein n=1 Tax=Mucilaginibacter ginkgonis TaxID=2682091 RepID=UPI0012F9FB67|nr:NAD(P)/FAD-dependent oxidoreductase [Mucilaginibacter ginkgonis]
MLEKRDYDAVVVGSGPNGLAAAIAMQQKGLSVLLIEGKETIGGGMRTAELTLPGFKHDICSAIHPLAISSPFFNTLPLANHGLEFIHSPIVAAHPFDDGTAAVLHNSLSQTAESLGADAAGYNKLFRPLSANWEDLLPDVLSSLKWPQHPLQFAQFGLKALPSAKFIADKYFKTEKAKGLFAGMAAHSMQALDQPLTPAVAMVLMLSGHHKGWPMIAGGSQNLANALARYFLSLGGKIETGQVITALDQLPSAHAILFDTGPQQLMQIAGHKLSAFYKWQLKRYKYGLGVFKVDWALDDVIPFTASDCREAATVHLGGTFAEIAFAEKAAAFGKAVDRPFVLLAQQSQFDKSRAPQGKHTAWGYCHVPFGNTKDMTEVIENQIERSAPGFRERVIGRHTFNALQMQDYNANYIGGDINGGLQNISQLFTRPALRSSPYRTSAKGIYICSASTPPGGGVHGMCGYYAAKRAMKDVFKIAD